MSHRSRAPRLGLFSLVLLAGLPLTTSAQGLRPPPSAEECARWEQELAAGGDAALNALTSGWLAACERGAILLSDAIRASRDQQSVRFLFGLASQAAQIRDGQVLDAALGLAADGRASRPARAAAMLVLVAMAGSGWDYPGVAGADLLTDPLPSSGLCGPAPSGRTFATERELPPDYRRRAAAVLDPIAAGGGAPLLKNLARCSRPVLGLGIPPQIDVSRVTLGNVCGTTFRVHNTTAEYLVFSFSVVGTEERGDLPIAAHKHREFTTTHDGTVQLSYDGRVIQSLGRGARPCK
jgi:hypothetical protein